MLLSKLEIYGFKSFPNKIALQFDEGIMAVVGPNGCGKTNILDSLRWVLGEQRSSLLRGSRVEEVLFNGTSQLRPMDMAEVSLTIKNNRGILPLEYDELVITRRLYRSGESEYLINKSRCRLKDIVELFSDTGMGTHAYSIFQQSMIDAVLSDKADERRFLFEEAAGITKYKNRKKEALKKLENTEIDLVRLNDIIAEISKNVRSLKRQAVKAKRYNKIKEELQTLAIARAAVQVYDFEQEIKIHSANVNKLKAEKTSIAAVMDIEEAAIEELKLQTADLNEQISTKANLASNLSEQAIHIENNLTSSQASLESGKINVQLWKSEIESLNARIESLMAEKKQTENQHADKSVELSELQKKLNRDEEQIDSLKEQLDKSQGNLDSIKELLHQHENKIAAGQARLEAVFNSLNRLNEINRDIDRSLEKYKAKKESSQENIDRQKVKLKECELEINNIDEKIYSNQQMQLSTISRIEEIRKAISSSNAEKSALEAKIEMLSRMVIEHEGYGSGIKSLFAWEQKPEGVIDTLVNLITADEEYHNAVEAAINNHGQLVVCKTRRDALSCIDYLKTNTAGRVSFLLLDSIPEPNVSMPTVDADGFIGSVADLITAQDFLQQAVRTLFADIAVFESGKIPHDYSGEAVDLDGCCYGRFGIIRGGKSSVTLIGRKSELSDLQDKLENINQKILELEKDLEDASNSLSHISDEASRLGENRKSALSDREKLISNITRLEFEFQESVNWLNELTANSAETGKQFESLNHQKAEIEKMIADETAKKQEIAGEFQQKSEAHRLLLDNYEKTVGELNQGRLKAVELSSYLYKLDEDSKRFGELVDEAQDMISKKSSNIDEEQNRWQEIEREQVKIKEQLANIFKAKDSVSQDRDGLSNQKNDLVEKLTKTEAKQKELRVNINNANEDIHREEIKLTDLNNRLDNIKENIFREYGTHISGDREEGYDEDRINSEIERLKNIIDKMGLVNMLADEEYNAEKDRLEFLEKQYKDLQDAKTSLVEVIRRINKTAEEKFSDTFELIKENFQEVFETLFDGGIAELKLINSDDLLETPIEIIARPGSKKLVSVNQLSGGERALTAISLLFAIYMVKPSPFCILDEIDAPLDDANVNRFLKLINKFTSSTQFIVITHNKMTMEAADLLYGITMEQPGVSNIVSVKLNGNKIESVEQV